MTSPARLVAITCIVLGLAGPLVAAPPRPVSVKVNPSAGFAPLTVRVQITIPQHPDNRLVCFSADSGNYTRSSCWEHGPDAPVTTWYELQRLPKGVYGVLVSLARADASVARAMVEVRVLGGGDDPDDQ